MVKKLLFVLMILFSLALVSADGAIVGLTAGVNPISGIPGDSVDVTLTLTSSADISAVSLTSTDLTRTGGAEKITAPTIPDMTSVVAGTDKVLTFAMTIPSVLAGTYNGVITGVDTSNQANTKSVNYALTVNTKNNFAITENELILSGEEDTTVSKEIEIENTGSTSLSFTNADFTYSEITKDDLTISLSFSSVTIAPGAKGKTTVTAVIPNKMDLDTYSRTITLTKSDATDTLDLKVRVQPEVCKDGEQGNILEIDVDNPDNGDEYIIGETISIEVKVYNKGEDNEDVRVEAFLYDLDDGDKIVDTESEVTDIDEKEDEDFTLELEIPTDDIDEDHSFVLYVKAYIKGDEDDNCKEEAIDIDIVREDHAMVVKQFLLNPASANCGGNVEATITVENIGSKNEDDVFIRLLNTGIGLDETSSLFDVDKAGKSKDDYTVRFNFNVPQGLTEKSYDLEAIVTFDDGDEKISDFKTLSIGQCSALPGQAKNVVLEVAEITGEIKQGKSVSIPVKLTSNEFGPQDYKISIDNVLGWADAIPVQTVTLSQGESQSLYFYLKALNDLDSGIYTAVVNVKSGSNIIATKTLSFEAKENPGLLSSVSDLFGDTNIFWIIGDIVLVVVAIFFVKLIFTGKKGRKEIKL